MISSNASIVFLFRSVIYLILYYTIFDDLFWLGTYNPNEVNWKQDIGLDMRGRSKLLKTSYRVTQDHMNFGFSMLLNDKKYAKEVEVFYETSKDVVLKNMSSNSIELLETDYRGVAQVYESLLEKYEYSDILLLAPSWYGVNAIKKGLAYDVQKHINSSKELFENKSIFTTYHSSKGIEAKVTIVVDIDKVKERKLLYVASTRASEKLIIHSQNIQRSIIAKEISEILDIQY